MGKSFKKNSIHNNLTPSDRGDRDRFSRKFRRTSKEVLSDISFGDADFTPQVGEHPKMARRDSKRYFDKEFEANLMRK